jgi:BirA family biotin operon repressor/biotin-[acetyl-CoA-carboxylase] ligase
MTSEKTDFESLAAFVPRLRSIRWFDEVGSTNDYAKEGIRSGEVNAPEIIGAEFQTGGRGRFGREWLSPAGKNLLFSLVIKIDSSYASSVWHQTCGIGVCLCRAVRKNHVPGAVLVWPNDIYIGRAKLAGMLFETAAFKGSNYLVAGMGLNVNQSHREFPRELRRRATSMVHQSGKEQDRTVILRDFIINYFDIQDSEWSAVWKEYVSMIRVMGREVASNGKKYRAIEVLYDGGLKCVDQDTGGECVLKSGPMEYV